MSNQFRQKSCRTSSDWEEVVLASPARIPGRDRGSEAGPASPGWARSCLYALP